MNLRGWAEAGVELHRIPSDVDPDWLVVPGDLEALAQQALGDGPKTVDGLLRHHLETRISDEQLRERLAWLNVRENCMSWRWVKGEWMNVVEAPLAWHIFLGIRPKWRWDQDGIPRKLVQTKHVPEGEVLRAWAEGRNRGVEECLPHFPRKVVWGKFWMLERQGLMDRHGLTDRGRHRLLNVTRER